MKHRQAEIALVLGTSPQTEPAAASACTAVRFRTLPPSHLARFTQLDYERDMAFIAANIVDKIEWQKARRPIRPRPRLA